jgi:predicted metal-dependent peptidase
MTDKLELVEIDAKQMKLWSDTRAALIWHCPAFTHILYTMMNKNDNEHIALFTKEVPVAATDGQHILINPDTFFPLSLNERIFVVAHEIAHGIFGHVESMHRFKMMGKIAYTDGKELPYDHETMNKAMDYVINDMLIESKIGQYNPNWLHDPVIATHKESVLTAYRRLYQDNQQNNGGKGGASASSQGKGQQGFDDHLAPGSSTGQDPSQAAAGRSDVEWKTAIAGAIASARAQGKLPSALERALTEVIEPQVDWREKIIGFFARKPGGGTYNWRSPDRRLITRNIIAPARSGFGAGPVVVAVDTSGSIGAKELAFFFGEMGGILDDVRPTMLYVIWCDAKVHRVDELENGSDLIELRAKKAPGGGGTAFEPVFEAIREMGVTPDALVYLTDGYGSFPAQAPSYPVLWGDISGGKVKYPFGDVVDIPIS